ncbi:dynamin family protein [Thioclava pacifica]|uniref:Dynamin N-terminal domain-containing protein n=1 Tax=Thioclava pacifica DSM 10166 TaxID=1353537 RepID=A0A074JIU4_9RHOB|nr:dynamin family protein [Thioclava pacifica]KEO56399.1 hypothetical protein TP2_02395 [Thioclava pacifica DSM 10166]
MSTLRKHQRPARAQAADPAAAPRSSNQPEAPARKLRVLVAGEFSAGKTRLINGLLGEAVLPSNVTATALPPIWLVSGAEHSLRGVDHEDVPHPIESLDKVELAKTRYCVISHPAPILDTIEIIDTPGSSDPNMPAETWRQMIDYADLVIWCTNATQAWRQSEKSIWAEMPEELRAHALLVITHGDRLTDERSAMRVMRRVKREAGSYFNAIMLASMVNPADITRVSNRIAQILPEITEPPGAPNAIVESFVRERSVIAFPKPRAEIRPRRVLHARLVKAATEAEITPSEEVSDPEVHESDSLTLWEPVVAPEPDEVSEPVELSDMATSDISDDVSDIEDISAPEEFVEPEADLVFDPLLLSNPEPTSDAAFGPEDASDDDASDDDGALLATLAALENDDTAPETPRALWAALSAEIDLSSAPAVLDCVERLLETLETRGDARPTRTDGPSAPERRLP